MPLSRRWRSGFARCGLRIQIRAGIDGVVTQNASDPDEIQRRLDDYLSDETRRSLTARNAQRRAYDRFLIRTQLADWLGTLNGCVCNAARRASSAD